MQVTTISVTTLSYTDITKLVQQLENRFSIKAYHDDIELNLVMLGQDIVAVKAYEFAQGFIFGRSYK